ncbi:MAG: hypothetical protein ACPGEF_07325 [Endozoicomonas sp.]
MGIVMIHGVVIAAITHVILQEIKMFQGTTKNSFPELRLRDES